MEPPPNVQTVSYGGSKDQDYRPDYNLFNGNPFLVTAYANGMGPVSIAPRINFIEMLFTDWCLT